MLLKKIEEELNEIIGIERTKALMIDLRREALGTHNLVDVYYRIMPNRGVYFFKRFLVDGNLVLQRMPINAQCLDSIKIETEV